MSDAEAARRKLNEWLARLRANLRGLPADEISDIVEELRSHALERGGGGPGALTAASMTLALTALGDPRELAGLYLSERMAARVELNRSPWLILTTVYRLAGMSLDACCVLLFSTIGYAIGGGFVLTALAKPFWPHRVGLWLLPSGGADLGISMGHTLHPVGQELLGWWIIPLGLLLGAAILFLTWRFGLAGVRRLGRAGAKLISARR
jgi:hypothetical protein